MPLYDYLLTHPYGSVGDVPTTPLVSYFYRPDFTNNTQLASFTTVGLALGSRIDCVFSNLSLGNVLVSFLLDSGPADPDDSGQVTPDDYNLSTNNVHWSKMGGG